MRNSNPAADLVENGLGKKSLHSFSHIRYCCASRDLRPETSSKMILLLDLSSASDVSNVTDQTYEASTLTPIPCGDHIYYNHEREMAIRIGMLDKQHNPAYYNTDDPLCHFRWHGEVENFHGEDYTTAIPSAEGPSAEGSVKDELIGIAFVTRFADVKVVLDKFMELFTFHFNLDKRKIHECTACSRKYCSRSEKLFHLESINPDGKCSYVPPKDRIPTINQWAHSIGKKQYTMLVNTPKGNGTYHDLVTGWPLIRSINNVKAASDSMKDWHTTELKFWNDPAKLNISICERIVDWQKTNNENYKKDKLLRGKDATTRDKSYRSWGNDAPLRLASWILSFDYWDHDSKDRLGHLKRKAGRPGHLKRKAGRPPI